MGGGTPCGGRRVYPRVGGGTQTNAPQAAQVYPRVGGGTPLRLLVYPRVGGGTVPALLIGGLSPRGRGNPLLRLLPFTLAKVYPRVGGGTTPSRPHRRGSLSPRGRGNQNRFPRLSQPLHWAKKGLSPRGRGNRKEIRSIPAGGTQARVLGQRGLSPRGRGNLSQWKACKTQPRVYPRVGGGTEPGSWDLGRLRSIPAWAGEPSCLLTLGGGTCRPVGGLSPRGRGNP